MCHCVVCVKWLCDYFFNSDFGKLVAIAVEFTIALAALLVENEHLVALYEGRGNFCHDFSTCDGGSTHFHCAVGVNEEHLVEFNSLSAFSIADAVYEKLAALLDLKLMTVDLYDCVHEMCDLCDKTVFSGGRASLLSPAPFLSKRHDTHGATRLLGPRRTLYRRKGTTFSLSEQKAHEFLGHSGKKVALLPFSTTLQRREGKRVALLYRKYTLYREKSVSLKL